MPVRLTFAYRVFRAEPGLEILLTAGHTAHTFLTREGRIARLDRHAGLWTSLRAVADGQAR